MIEMDFTLKQNLAAQMTRRVVAGNDACPVNVLYGGRPDSFASLSFVFGVLAWIIQSPLAATLYKLFATTLARLSVLFPSATAVITQAGQSVTSFVRQESCYPFLAFVTFARLALRKHANLALLFVEAFIEVGHRLDRFANSALLYLYSRFVSVNAVGYFRSFRDAPFVSLSAITGLALFQIKKIATFSFALKKLRHGLYFEALSTGLFDPQVVHI